MKLSKIVRGKARVAKETCGKDETCGQTPQEEVQLRDLGWTERDIDHMSAKQVELILKKRTRKRAKASAEVRAKNTPEQIKAILQQVEGAKGVQGAHHQVGKDWYVDTEFINHSQQVYPGATLRHMGMGEFVLETPDGDIEFDRMRGKDFPGQSGRSHKLYGDPKAVAKLLKLMEQKGKSKKAEVQAAEGGWQTVKINGKPYRWRKNDLFKKNPHTQAALDIQYENPKVGWRDVVNLGTRDQVFKAVIKKASVKAATKFSPFGTPGGTWWGKRAEDSKIMSLKEPVAKQWAAKPSMKDKPPQGQKEYLAIYWVPPEYGRESRWRVEKGWITPLWDWGLGPNKKVKPGVDVVKQQS